MIDTPSLAETESHPAAVIHFTIPREKIREVMGPGFQELFGTLAEQGVTPAGPAFSHHHRMDPETFDFDLGVPVSSPVKAAGRVTPGEQPGGRVIQAVYHGGYEGLPEAWGEFDAWIRESGHETAADLWERYVVGPESSQTPGEWRTELNRRLK